MGEITRHPVRVLICVLCLGVGVSCRRGVPGVPGDSQVVPYRPAPGPVDYAADEAVARSVEGLLRQTVEEHIPGVRKFHSQRYSHGRTNDKYMMDILWIVPTEENRKRQVDWFAISRAIEEVYHGVQGLGLKVVRKTNLVGYAPPVGSEADLHSSSAYIEYRNGRTVGVIRMDTSYNIRGGVEALVHFVHEQFRLPAAHPSDRADAAEEPRR